MENAHCARQTEYVQYSALHLRCYMRASPWIPGNFTSGTNSSREMGNRRRTRHTG
jgi:hypothetical protein